MTTVDLSRLLTVLTADYMDYAQPLAIRFSIDIEPDVQTYGDAMLLKKRSEM